MAAEHGYVAANRFRTGLTLAMFALVVLSLTVSAVMLTATRVAYADPDAVTGGWDIHVQSTLPPRDLRADLAASGVVSPDAFTAIGAGVTADGRRASRPTRRARRAGRRSTCWPSTTSF